MKSIKFLRLTLVGLLFSILLSPMLVNAQSEVPNGQQLIFGQAQAYDVLMRGNGEAVVNTRLTITNTDDASLSTLKYQISGARLSEATAFQEVEQTQCFAGTAVDLNQPPDIKRCINPQKQPDEPYNYSYPYSQKIYKKATVTIRGQDVTIRLPNPVTSNQSATIIFVYAASGYVKHSLGSNQFTFQTLKSDSRTSSVTVAISVDEGYQLAHANSKVNYQTLATGKNLSSELASGANLSSDSNNKISSYIQGIGNSGQIIKNASQLSAHESLTVKGTYAVSWWRLHIIGLLECLALLVALLGATVWYVIRKQRRNRGKPTSSGPPKITSGTDANNIATTTNDNDNGHIKPEEVTNTMHWWHSLPFAGLVRRICRRFAERRVRPLFVGMLCAVLIVLLLAAGFLVAWLISFASDYATYNTSIWSFLSGLVAMLVGVLLFVVIGFGLPILYGHTKGIKTIIKIMAYEALFFLILLIVFTCLSFMYRSSATSYPPDYRCGGGLYEGACFKPN